MPQLSCGVDENVSRREVATGLVWVGPVVEGDQSGALGASAEVEGRVHFASVVLEDEAKQGGGLAGALGAVEQRTALRR